MEKNFKTLSSYFETIDKITGLICEGKTSDAIKFSNKGSVNGKSVKEIIKSWSGLDPDDFFELAGKIPDVMIKSGKLKKSGLVISRKKPDKNARIVYSGADTRFGRCVISIFEDAITGIDLPDKEEDCFKAIKKNWPCSVHEPESPKIIEIKDRIFSDSPADASGLEVILDGTDFQVRVWETLAMIPMNEKLSYSDIAESIDKKRASRAVGNAVGANPIIYLIPCHRVLPKSGDIGGFGCGPSKKLAMLIYEAIKAKNNP